jgi:hypothetical protein
MMSKVIIFLCVGGALFAWRHHVLQQRKGTAAASATAPAGRPGGFVDVPCPTGVDPKRVFMLLPAQCTKASYLRGVAMLDRLGEMGIPYVRADKVEFTPTNAGEVERLNQVMGGEIPVVFINNRGKANPSLDEIVAEYRAIRRS